MKEETESAEDIKKRIILFVAVTFVLSALVYILMFLSETLAAMSHVLLAWLPAAGAILTQLICRRNLRDLGWRWGKTRYQLLALAYPLAANLPFYAVIWAVGLGGFSAANLISRSREIFNLTGQSASTALALYIGYFCTAGLLAGTVMALGEELGWRGLLVPELAKVSSFSKTSLISGVVWIAWHYPVFFLVAYPGISKETLVWKLIPVTLSLLAGSFILAWLRLKSGSVWTAAIMHGGHNVFVQEILDPATVDTGLTFHLVGEFGILSALVVILVGYTFWRMRDRLPDCRIAT